MKYPSERELLERIDRRVGRIARVVYGGFILICISFVWLGVLTAIVLGQSQATYAAARADRQQFSPEDHGYIFYLSWDTMPPEDAAACGPITAITVSSYSRTMVLEQHLPAPVARDLVRIDLRSLGWNWKIWHKVLSRYPYAPDKHLPLVVRADWLIVELWDQFESPAGYELLYGKPPATRDEFLKFWGVQNRGVRDPLLLAHVEKESGVSLLQFRKIENFPVGNRSYAWGTEDTAERNFNARTDWLQNFGRETPHDAEEWIVGFPKVSIVQEIGGAAQAYLLANGEGKRQDRAPTDIVKDSTAFRGLDEIRNGGSCLQCHTRGINNLTTNALRDRVARGAELYLDKATQELTETQFLTEGRLKTDIERNSEDYVRFVALTTGMDPETMVRSFKTIVNGYDRPLTAADCARELSVDTDQFNLALGWASANGVKLDGFVADLPTGGTIPRPYWESSFKYAHGAVQRWKAVGK